MERVAAVHRPLARDDDKRVGARGFLRDGSLFGADDRAPGDFRCVIARTRAPGDEGRMRSVRALAGRPFVMFAQALELDLFAGGNDVLRIDDDIEG